MILSIMLLGVSIFELILQNIPLLVSVSFIVKNDEKFDLWPSKESNTMSIAYALYIIQIAHSILLMSLGIFGYLIKTKQDVGFCQLVEKYILIFMGTFTIIIIASCVLSDLYMKNIALYNFKNNVEESFDYIQLPSVMSIVFSFIAFAIFILVAWRTR